MSTKALALLANCPLPPLESYTEGRFFEKFEVVRANLPSRRSDDITGEVVAETYWQTYGSRPRSAIDYLVSQALHRCQWFPTIKECDAILAEWTRSDRASANQVCAQGEIRRRHSVAMSALKARSMTQAEIDALPDRWKRHAAEQCFVWACRDGSFRIRADTTLMTPDELIANRKVVAHMAKEGLL